MGRPAAKPGTVEVGNVEVGTVGTFPTLRTSDSYRVLTHVGHKTEVRNLRTSWDSGIPGSTPFRPGEAHKEAGDAE